MRTYHQQYTENLCNNLTRWLKRKSRRISPQLTEAALILMRIDMESIRPTLESMYSPNPRGRKPYDPVCMFRAMMLMMLLEYESITQFVRHLRAKPRLAVIAGFANNTREHVNTPSVGAFYLFIDRLEDGKYAKHCHHYIKPSELRKIKHMRNLRREKQQRKDLKKRNLQQYDSVTQKLKAQLKAEEDQARPDDLSNRLLDILIKCAIIPSANRGLLGQTQALTISGDGSSLVTGASPHGKSLCDCRKKGIYDCDCPRYYTDPTADWGYDSYREKYYFGHTFYQHVVSASGHDLPVQVDISRASETDFTLSMKGMDKLKKALKENGLNWKIENAVYDAGHDAMGVYDYLMDNGIKPVIALNTRTGVYPVPTGSAKKVNEEGIPICPAGKLMRRHGYSSAEHRIYYNCPVKRPTRKNGKYIYVAYPDECPRGCLCSPQTRLAPVVYVKTSDDPRLYPPIPRGSPKYKKLMNLRSGCERSNSIKKEKYKLGRRPCRSSTHFLVRLYLVSIIEHARAWLAEDRKQQNTDDPIALMKTEAA